MGEILKLSKTLTNTLGIEKNVGFLVWKKHLSDPTNLYFNKKILY
jgi:hypothetical protein